MTELKSDMSNDCDCDKSPNQKNKWSKIFHFGKKKKKKKMEEHLNEEDISSCPICSQKGLNTADNCIIDAYEEKQRLKAEASRVDSNVVSETVDDSRRPECGCIKCRRARGEDPLTVELLPMETQITLANSLQDTVLMCEIL